MSAHGRTIFWSKYGPKLSVMDDNVLKINDLNPERETKWVLGRKEILKIGLGLTWHAITHWFKIGRKWPDAK